MAEALALVGLASNILQFIELGQKLTKRVWEFVEQTDDVPQSIVRLQERLPIILHVLNQVHKRSKRLGLRRDSDNFRGGLGRTGDILDPVVKESYTCAERLIDILDDLRPRSDARKRERVGLALKSFSKDEEIHQLVTKLDKNIALLAAFQTTNTATNVDKLSEESKAGLGRLSAEVNDGFRSIQLSLVLDFQREKLLEWIGPFPSSDEYESYSGTRVQETCTWIFERQAFIDWRDAPAGSKGRSLLWIHGSSGVGKTFLAASITEKMSKDARNEVFAYFCRQNQISTSTHIVQAFLARMIMADDMILETFQRLYKARRTLHASHRELWEMFRLAVSKPNSYIFVIDGLDEQMRTGISPFSGGSVSHPLEGQPSFLQSLVLATASTTSRVLIVSQDIYEIRSVLARATSSLMLNIKEYQIREDDITRDALLLARHVVDIKLHKKELQFRTELAESLAQKSSGQMLWVSLQKDTLSSSFKDNKLRQVVQDLPKGIRDSYDREVRTISNLPPLEKTQAETLLRWALFAKGPLTLHLLVEALLVDVSAPADVFPDDEIPADLNDEDVYSAMQKLCSFIEFQKDGSDQEQKHWLARFPHASRNEYLMCVNNKYPIEELQNFRFSDEKLQHSLLAQTCLQVLYMENIWSSPEDGSTSLDTVILQRPIMKYAVQNWPLHTSLGISESARDRDINHFMRSENTMWCQWRDAYERLLTTSGPEVPSSFRPGTRLYYACDFGWFETAKQQLDAGEDPTQSCGEKGSPLHAAISNGAADMIALLLRYATDLNVSDAAGNSPLHNVIMSVKFEAITHVEGATPGRVATSGRAALPKDCKPFSHKLDLVEALLDLGANLEATNHHERTPLYLAAFDGHKAIVELLISRGANIHATDDMRRTPLYVSAWNGHKEVVEFLIQHKADIMMSNKNSVTPLSASARMGHEAVVKLLIDHGADITVPNAKGGTPLFEAAHEGHQAVVEMLIMQGGDVSERGRGGWSTIKAACRHDNKELIALLLKHGADITASDEEGWKPLHTAAQYGSKEVANTLIEHGATITDAVIGGCTAMHIAAISGSTAMVSFLLEHGAPLAHQNDVGCTPLYLAALEGQVEVVSLLLRNGADATINMTRENGWTPVNVACDKGHTGIVSLLIEYGADLAIKTTDYGWTPLYSAASEGHLDIVKLLLDHGAEPTIDIANAAGWTPVNSAAEAGYPETVKHLLERGADPLKTSDYSWSPLYSAARKGNFDTVKLLFQYGAKTTINLPTTTGWTPLNIAAQEGSVEIVRYLLDHGADVTLPEEDGRTPLYSAAQHGPLAIVNLLIQHGAKTTMETASSDGWTPLNAAADNGRKEAVELLLSLGASINTTSDAGWTPINAAAECGHEEVVAMLLKHGADITIAENNGWTPLHAAAVRGKEKVVDILLDQKANIKARTNDGSTPLHGAARSGNPKITKRLLDAGAMVQTTNIDSRTPLHEASQGGHTAVVELLLEHGADISAPDKHGRTPLHMAAERARVDVVEMLVRNSLSADIIISETIYQLILRTALSVGSETLIRSVLSKNIHLPAKNFMSAGQVLASALLQFPAEKTHVILEVVQAEAWCQECIQELFCLAMEKDMSAHVRRTLVAAGAKIEVVGPYGWTPTLCDGLSKSLKPASYGPQAESSVRLPQPTRWVLPDDDKGFQACDEDREFCVCEDIDHIHLQERVNIPADFFMPADRDSFYFEIEYLTVGPRRIVGLGFCHLACSREGMPGWHSNSWGYHGDDGCKFDRNGEGKDYGPTFGAGDVVGCGIDFLTGSAFFTKNGEHLGIAFTELTGRLLPICGVGEKGVRLKVNFGASPFAYDSK